MKNINHYTNVRGLPSIEKIVSSVEDTPRPISTQIIGTIPEWIKGNFLRNGPGKFEIGNHKWVLHLCVFIHSLQTSWSSLRSALHLFLYRFNHWVDGMALLHQFKISNGQVTYKSRFLSSDSYQTNKEHNRIAISEFGTVTMPDPCKNVFQRFLSRFESHSEYLEDKAACWCTCYRISNSKLSFPLEPTDNANMSFVTYKGDYYVSTETNIMHKVDPDTLETEKVPWV